MTTSESRSKSRRQGIFRAIPRGVVLGCAGIFATLFWNILAALGADFSLRLTFALAIAVIALTIEITKELDRRKGARLELETKRRDWDKRAQASMYQWPPAVAADADMYALGVKRGYMRLADATGGAGLPYVERDADRGAREGLQGHGQILLIGAQLSGVTRLAYEVARNERLSPIIIAPRAPDGLADIVYDLDIASHLPERTYAILWLNDIDRYKQGCDVATLKQLRHQLPGLRVIATIATTKYPDWAAENAELREFFGSQIRLKQALSAAESSRASKLYPAVDFRHGVAAAFMGIPRLLSKIDLGNSSCRFDASEGDCELAREVVKIAAGWTSTSTSRKLSKTTLRSLLGESPDCIDEDFPEHLDSVLEWLSLPVSPGCFIIEPTKHGVTGNIEFNASLGAVVSEMAGGPELSVWNAAIADAVRSGEGDVLGRVGYEAYCTGNQPAADLAWRHITEYDDPAIQWMHRAAGFSFKKLLEPGFHAELQRAENTKSIPLLERLVELLNQRRPPDPIGVAEAEMRLAFAYRGATENDKALQSFEHAAELIQQELGPNDVKLAKVLDDIAVTSVGTEKSRRAQERALEIRKVSGDPNIVFSLFNLASSCMTSDPARARNYLVKALEISSSPNSRRPDFLIPVIISQLQLLGVRVFRGPDGRPMPELETSGPSDLAN